ncbi:glycoside hydrolase family 2 TIM barrel-domain containing protein [Pontibacter sp. G13]|uniref:glycoside hydrolase family 2 TIM barrel-domain containing protein n=1 Tax=Pontibacter sp. G13 TaxID=3074898 RepID=UPI00288C4F45|nr:glycoside hydrolase family 2 TIM barrel-domain containing protein [Pontibacter sp. G13]WNJ16577.1 glycoside hydrolase family 2 TIM barrel-domain containing protein [Pontibacter sp. G13]
MKARTYSLLAIMLLLGVARISAQSPQPREVDFNFDWKFTLMPDTTKPAVVPMTDADWQDVRLPHDWSVSFSFDSTLEGCTGYLPGGVGVYQKHFATPANRKKATTYIVFDGVYNHATFWLNGKRLGQNPYGYSPVAFDLTKYLKQDGSDNVLTVHVDHSRYADSRWYTGSGIYRKVKLVTVDKLHIPIWGTYLTTPVINEEAARVQLEVKVRNDMPKKRAFTLATKILGPDGRQVASASETHSIGRRSQLAFNQSIVVPDPQLWDCEHPHMYKAITEVVVDGEVVDEYTTPFGIRTLEFAAKKGFFLNGQNTLIKGVCLHHDGGLVGTAVPEGVWRRRLAKLKEAGVNGIRTSHNPFSEEFLNLCDEMGFLVQHELFDEMDYPKDKRQNYHDRHDDYITRGYTEQFQEWGRSDLERTLLRDRNHPSIIQWSIGNEIEWAYLHYRYITGFWEDPNDPQNAGKFWGSRPMFSPEELKERYDNWEKGEYILAETAQRLSDWVKEFDTTRPTTANHILPQVSHVSGYADAVDISGYSYRNSVIPWAQTYFPDQQVTINECPGTWDDWKQVLENPGVFSMFMWTGIDYIGERDGDWPQKSAWGDILDLAGFPEPGFNYFKSIWVNEPHISIGTLPVAGSQFTVDSLSGQAVAKNIGAYKWRGTNMHWNYEPGEMVLVEICTNHTTAELFLNGKSLGQRSMSESPDRLMRCVVPYEPGVLTAKAGFTGAEISSQIFTTGTPKQFTLAADKTTLTADAYDVAHVVVQLTDDQGLPVKTENTLVEFEVEGPARLLGVDNGADDNHQDFQADHIVTDKGRCLLLVQSLKEAGTIRITAKSATYGSQTIELNSVGLDR